MQGNTIVVTYNSTKFKYNQEALLKTETFPFWQKTVKRMVDILVSLAGIVFLSPLFIYIAIRIKLDSTGPVFYFQQRIGLYGNPFTIFKFRSMCANAEMFGPTLSSPGDTRVTKWGAIMRKWKLDELPQLLNVLAGTMSLVGPRPERKFYIDRVSEICPFFPYLHQVKPGLTSLGMIRFGYAHDIDQIIRRMKYDISYIESYSLLLDIKILYYTLPAIMDGKFISPALKFKSGQSPVKLQSLN